MPTPAHFGTLKVYPEKTSHPEVSDGLSPLTGLLRAVRRAERSSFMGTPSIESRTVSTDCFGVFNSPLLEYMTRRDTAMQMMRPLYFDRHLTMRELRAFGERLMSIPQVPCSFSQPVLPHPTASDCFLQWCVLSVQVTSAAAHLGEAGVQIASGTAHAQWEWGSYLACVL